VNQHRPCILFFLNGNLQFTANMSFKSPSSEIHINAGDNGGIQMASRDDAALERLGKKPVLNRTFGFMTSLGFSCTVLITWEGSLFTFLAGLQNGGPSGIIYGYILVWAGMLSLMATMAELVSMAPTSGGQYHWVSMLAPVRYQKFLGYITGWLTVTGWQATLASAGLLTGTLIQNVVLLTHPEYQENMENWHGTLLLWAVLFLIYAINTILPALFVKFEGYAFILHILGFFAILFPLVFLAPKTPSTEVWDNWYNLGDWETQGLSFCIGIVGTVFAFAGADAAVHLSEEIRDAPIVVPWALITTLLVNGTLGFAMLITTLYCMGDLDAAVEQSPAYPFMAIFHNAVGSAAGATVMSCIIIVMIFVASTGALASTSRVFWALSRDRALPGWSWLRKTSPRTNIPRNAVATVTVIAGLLSLINIGDATAFNGVISISIAGLNGSYLIVAVLLLYRRLTGGIREIQDPSEVTNTIGSRVTWGPWRLPGWFGIANNILTCCFLMFVLFFSFWPTYREVTPATMNWAVVVTVAVLAFSVVYYFAHARKVYRGPIIEV
jgi:choline transport protein